MGPERGNQVKQDLKSIGRTQNPVVVCLVAAFIFKGLRFLHLSGLLPVTYSSILGCFFFCYIELFVKYLKTLLSSISSFLNHNQAFILKPHFFTVASQGLIPKMPALAHIDWPQGFSETANKESITLSTLHLS